MEDREAMREFDADGDMETSFETEMEDVRGSIGGGTSDEHGVPVDIPLAEVPAEPTIMREPDPDEPPAPAPQPPPRCRFGVPAFSEDGSDPEAEMEPYEGDASPRFENPVEYSDRGLEDDAVRAIAIAEPMTAHDAQIVALGDSVRQVTNLIESVGRTLEAQNQRSLRLMERLESVAKVLEVMPDEADRGLEALDAVEETILAQTPHLKHMSERLDDLPDVVRAVRESTESSRELFTVATRALASRMAYDTHASRLRERREAKGRTWRMISGAALALAAFVGGALVATTDGGRAIRTGLAAAIAPSGGVAEAGEGERTWRVVDVRVTPPPALPEAPVGLPLCEDPLPFGVDEQAGG